MNEDLGPGCLVFSKAGRDKEKPFIVVGMEEIGNINYVYLADGEQRKVQCPKRKNIKHVQVTKARDSEIQEKLSAGQPISNLEVRGAIARLLASYRCSSFSSKGGR
ncbi:MAG: RNA-binding protein [Clostridia bacterium]|jgi:large subunit ribosomal protein L14e|nr:RNA-binding protein [Clostridia bacterium]